MSKKIAPFLTFLLLTVSLSFPQIVLNNDRFSFDRKVDNAFIAQYTVGDPDYFEYFFAIDSAKEQNSGIIGGCGAEQYFMSIYYFNEKRNYKILGLDNENRKSFIKKMGKIAYTSDRKVYVIDISRKAIFWWSIDQKDSFNPSGQLDKVFKFPADICKDQNDILYILDSIQKKIFKYNTKTNTWMTFAQNAEYLDLSLDAESEWGNSIALAVNSNGIYVVYGSGVIVHCNYSAAIT